MDIEGCGNIPNDIGEEESEGESEEGEVDYQTKSQDMEGGEGQFEPQPRSQGGFQNEPQVETADALEDAIKDLTNLHSDRENVYFELPKLNLKKVVIDNEFIHNNLNLSWVDQQQDWNKMMKERKLPYSSNLYLYLSLK